MIIKAYSKSELCDIYKISLKVLRRWLNEIETDFAKNVRILSPLQVEKFISVHGLPEKK